MSGKSAIIYFLLCANAGALASKAFFGERIPWITTIMLICAALILTMLNMMRRRQ